MLTQPSLRISSNSSPNFDENEYDAIDLFVEESASSMRINGTHCLIECVECRTKVYPEGYELHWWNTHVPIYSSEETTWILT
jgi:hypothetical protein